VSTRYTPAYDIYLGEGDGSWQEASRYQVWTRKDALTAPALSVLERRDGNVLRVPDRSRVMHRIPGGTPYHIEHLFGFWRTTGADTIFIRAEADDSVYYTLIVATSGEDVGTDTVSWYCPKCQAELESHTHDSARYGLPAFWTRAGELARAFNESKRTCAACGHAHPPAYGFGAAQDTVW
jgi:hypothetical protein